MALTSMLLFLVMALFAGMVLLVIAGIKGKNWKMVVLPVGSFLAIVLLMYFGLLRFITSM